MKNMLTSLILIAVLSCLITAGCNRGETPTVEGPTIALILKTLNNPFFIDIEKGAQEACEKLGINLVVQGAERDSDVEKQMQIMENLIQRGVDAICLVPSGSKEIIPAILKANRANIPVLILDNRVNADALKKTGGKISIFIGSDNFEGGRIAAHYLAGKLGENGKLAVLEGVPGQEAGDQRLKGFLEAIKEHSGVEVVASQAANWEMDQAFNVTQNMLQAHPEIQALFSCNDNMALGAIEAISAVGKTGEIIVVGFDATDDARDAIRKGTMEGSLAQYPTEIGKLGIENANKILKGETIPDYIPTKIELITKDKLD